MPLLSLNYGLSDITALYLPGDGTSVSFTIGYPYSRELYSHFYSEQEYYTDIFNHILEKLKVKKTGLQVIATGFPYIPTIGSEYLSAVTLDKLFGMVEEYRVVCADNYTIFTQDSFLSLQNRSLPGLGQQEKNYLANLHIYKNAFPTTLSHYNLLFANIWQMVNTLNGQGKDTKHFESDPKPILFLGDLFTTSDPAFANIAFLYMTSLIKVPGIFNLSYDPSNLMPHRIHIKAFDPSLTDSVADTGIEELGTLVNSPGNTACLIETGIGTSQLIELQKGKMFFMPMTKDTDARILLKNDELGSIEKKVTGGKIGFIIDTRPKHKAGEYTYSDLQQDININLRYMNEVVNSV